MKVYPKHRHGLVRNAGASIHASYIHIHDGMALLGFLEPVSRSMYNLQIYPEPDYVRNAKAMRFSVFVFM
jgi:hypothetical protein